MSIYTYSVTHGFATEQNIDLITAEIEGSDITETLTSITTIGDTLTILFENDLSDSEKQTLMNIINTADAPVNRGNSILSYPVNITVRTTEYFSVLTTLFPGSASIQNITNIELCSFMESGGTSYTVRLFDLTNNAIICTNTFTNTQYQMNDMGTLANIPLNSAVIDLQCKVTGATTAAVLKSLSIIYN